MWGARALSLRSSPIIESSSLLPTTPSLCPASALWSSRIHLDVSPGRGPSSDTSKWRKDGGGDARTTHVSGGGACPRIMIVAREPLTFCGNEGAMGLSEPVAVAVDAAITTVDDLVDELLERKVLS